jgi:hypothetical protein
MTDTKAIIKELCSIIDCTTNITLFSEKLKLISDNKKTFVFQYILTKNFDNNHKHNIKRLLESLEFINLFVNNSIIICDIIICILTNFCPERSIHSNLKYYNLSHIKEYIGRILQNKKVTLKKEDYKTFHDTAYKYLHNKCDDVYELYNIFTKYECEDMLFNDDIIENDADKKDKEIERLKLEMEEMKKFYINS